MIYKTIFIDGPSVNSYLASVVQSTNKLVPDYARGKDMQENLSFTHATGQIFFTALVLDLSALYSRGPAVISFQDKPTWSQRVAASKKKKIAKVFALFGYVSIFPCFLFLARGKSDGSLLLYKGSTPFVALKTEFRQISVPRIFRRGKTLRARGALPRPREEEEEDEDEDEILYEAALIQRAFFFLSE